ncbi:hypothetical protein KSF_001330 [Reticulibacter mediterranei]|uniref:Uncharacterized protein n=1 Tax=Reticulibacter mediterranei TaxID=2778369 RepID=A0A8J3MZD3_9CHLR|nr:hypothetical protein KSF_001330 [Reticulibacter mediterranei]
MACAVTLVQFRVIEGRWRRLCVRRKLVEEFLVLLEKREDQVGEASRTLDTSVGHIGLLVCLWV